MTSWILRRRLSSDSLGPNMRSTSAWSLSTSEMIIFAYSSNSRSSNFRAISCAAPRMPPRGFFTSCAIPLTTLCSLCWASLRSAVSLIARARSRGDISSRIRESCSSLRGVMTTSTLISLPVLSDNLRSRLTAGSRVLMALDSVSCHKMAPSPSVCANSSNGFPMAFFNEVSSKT